MTAAERQARRRARVLEEEARTVVALLRIAEEAQTLEEARALALEVLGDG
jgi:hypothetical protein